MDAGGMGTASLLALDAGTTGITAILFDEDLEVRGRFYREFPQHYPRPGWVEHDAGEILAALDSVMGEALVHPASTGLRAIGLTNQRETVFALERKSGRALGRGIVWQDRRTAARCEELRAAGKADWVRRKTGLLLDPYFSATKIEWMLRNDADLSARARAGEVVFGTVDVLVNAYLTGGAMVSDPTNASRTMLFDLDTQAFDGELCELFGVDPSWLPRVIPSGGMFGSTTPERCGGRGLAIHGVAGDQQAALFGQGGFEAGSLKATFGTGAFLLLNTGAERVDSSQGLVTTLAVGPDGHPSFALEGSVFICGAAIQFLRDQFGFIESAAEVEALAREVEDTGGVFFVPAFTGLGAPYWDAEARGALLGLTRGTTRAHVARAALEGMALQNVELIELLRKESGLPLETLLADGGAAANDLLMQLQADLAGVTVLRPPSVEATARGAALLAGLGIGLWDDPSRPQGLRGEPERFLCRMDPQERTQRLGAWRGAVARTLS